ncbi:peptidoglycan-binding protein [Chitinispirillales bacterium ANBcel5]|uniref:peptidoglycan-binding protein n=1 Tax=Cellulosispirillum alkaliphilum TaxID=3039283 RepID=UPI002A5969B0|nr:peptidoglycan-binding protein [Chitinispirillales bacterium ANBcel5]
MYQYSFPLNLGFGTDITKETIEKIYKHIEETFPGGYYPIGGNTVWHGGVHLMPDEDKEVYASLPGKIVAARLPEDENLAIRHYGSSNFILMKHSWQEKQFYSLYMHLKNVELREGDKNFESIGWLFNREERESIIDQLKTGSVIKLDIPVNAGDTLWISSEFGSSSSRRKILHWEIFSQNRLVENPAPEDSEGNKEWVLIEDDETDYNVDCKKVLSFFPQEMLEDDNLTIEELIQFYSENPDGNAHKLRYAICKFIPEWAIQDLETAVSNLKNKGFSSYGLVNRIRPYVWWHEAKKAGVDLPDATHVWHYNPVKLMEVFSAPSQFYGGYVLKKGDNDSNKTFGGNLTDSDGEYVRELQQDLLRLGYWISNPSSTTGKGMVVDGDFGEGTENALKTFQFEHYVVQPDGSKNVEYKNRITGELDKETADKIKEKIENIGDKVWDRPGHKPHAEWEVPENGEYKATYTPNRKFKPDGVLFYQLPPSEGYYRFNPSSGERKKYQRGNSWKCTPYKIFDDDDAEWMMADCWGTLEQITLMKEIGDKWLSENGEVRTVKDSDEKSEAVKPFRIGEISGFNGGAMGGHSGHQDGNSADLNRSGSNSMCHVGYYSDVYHRNQTYLLCRLLVEAGIRKIQFNCHYIIKNLERVQECPAHHHHIHFDGSQSQSHLPMGNNRRTTCADCNLEDSCEYRIHKVRYNSEWDDYDEEENYINKGNGVVRLFDSSNQKIALTKAEWEQKQIFALSEVKKEPGNDEDIKVEEGKN